MKSSKRNQGEHMHCKKEIVHSNKKYLIQLNHIHKIDYGLQSQETSQKIIDLLKLKKACFLADTM